MKHEIKWRLLIPAVLLPLAAGGLAALLTGSAMESYSLVETPPMSPPGWVFPVAWTVLYILMGLASYLVALSPASRDRRERALSIYALQLAVNFAWPVIFFKLSAYGAAFFWLLLLLALVLFTQLLFRHISSTAGKLLLPYLLWLLFALYLNLGVWLLN